MQWETAIRFVLAALATWRLSFLLVREEGPWHFAERIRKSVSRDGFGELLTCVKCTSVWVALPFAFYVGKSVVGNSFTELVVIWLALSGVAALIDEVTRPPFEWQGTEDDELLPSGTTDRSHE